MQVDAVSTALLDGQPVAGDADGGSGDDDGGGGSAEGGDGDADGGGGGGGDRGTREGIRSPPEGGVTSTSGGSSDGEGGGAGDGDGPGTGLNVPVLSQALQSPIDCADPRAIDCAIHVEESSEPTRTYSSADPYPQQSPPLLMPARRVPMKAGPPESPDHAIASRGSAPCHCAVRL